jgi:hypothetical protein
LRQEIESLIGTPRRNWISSERNLDKVVNDPAEGIESDCHWNVCTAGGTSGDCCYRRDIEVRERKCQELETAVIDAERERGRNETRVEALKRTRRVEELRRSYENEPSCTRRLVNLEDSGRLEKKANRCGSGRNREREIQRLQENDARGKSRPRNSTRPGTNAYTEQLQAALRDAESSTIAATTT